MIKVLFVCMGNICRSPTAEGVFRQRVEQAGLKKHIQIDSAGTHNYHAGGRPDQRSQKVAQQRGYNLSALRARKVQSKDFEIFDYILAMDRANLDDMLVECPEQFKAKMKLFLGFASGATESEVPDPYYGGPRGFDWVLDLVEQASDGLLQQIVEDHSLVTTKHSIK